MGGVLRVGVVGRDAPAQRADPVVVAAQQHVERGAVTALRGGDESLIVELGADAVKLVVGDAGVWERGEGSASDEPHGGGDSERSERSEPTISNATIQR